MQYWLFKTEPSTYSIDDLKAEKTTEWYGVRNYQARNFLRDSIRKGDKVLIYHSNTKEIGVVGVAQVVSDTYPDTHQFDPKSPYFDPKSKKENPAWVSRDVRFVKKFPRILTLEELKKQPTLKEMFILRKGNRLSITPVTSKDFLYIGTLANKKETC